LTFSSVTGRVSCCGGGSRDNGPDGSAGATSVAGHGGISGIQAPSTIFLVGVFLDDTEPTDPSPAALNFDSTGFTHLSPQLRQTFFIGDGRTGSSSTAQLFRVPPLATRLFLGFVDASGFSGDAGYYDDNTGELRAVFAISRDADSIKIVELKFVRGDGSEPLSQLNYGEPFHLQARFSAPPPESARMVKLEWGGGGGDIPIYKQRDGRVFRSGPLYLETPTTAIEPPRAPAAVPPR
jgi:hypothetical protein